jgi:hypothetical protein
LRLVAAGGGTAARDPLYVRAVEPRTWDTRTPRVPAS